MSIHCRFFSMCENKYQRCSNCVRNKAKKFTDNFKTIKEDVDPIITNNFDEYAEHSDELLKLREENKKKNRT